jgi:predicted alpha/beta superfamily hydrolase
MARVFTGHFKMIAMKYMAGIIITMLTVTAQAQYTVKISITGLPAAPATDAVYLAGNFNNWNPQDESFRLQKNEKGVFFIEIQDVDPATYEFKFTRGSWDKGETNSKGDDLPNRKTTIGSDTAFQFSIAGWKDGFAKKQKPSTASVQVSIIDTVFAMPQLNRTRRIWVYLPKGYETSRKKYPVLYMHDGQNLFDNATSFAGEWGIDEAMDSIKNACIVIGIDNGGVKRMNEYNPNNTKQFGKGEGKAYLAFIVNNLKPFIDKKYRTLADKQHTYMAGSSMGGLISFYAGLYYPNTFGALGVFSPSFWIAPQVKTQLKELAKKTLHGKQKYYFYAGGAEGKAIVEDMKAIAGEMKKAANPKISITVNPEGKHNEPTWSAVFPEFYKWIL